MKLARCYALTFTCRSPHSTQECRNSYLVQPCSDRVGRSEFTLDGLWGLLAGENSTCLVASALYRKASSLTGNRVGRPTGEKRAAQSEVASRSSRRGDGRDCT